MAEGGPVSHLRLLVVTRNAVLRDELRVVFATEATLHFVDDPATVMQAIRQHHPDAVLLDADLPETDMIALGVKCHTDADGQIPALLFMTSAPNDALIVRAAAIDADIVPLPMSQSLMRLRVRRATDAWAGNRVVNRAAEERMQIARQAQEAALLDHVRTVLARAVDLTTVMRSVVEGIVQTFGYTQVSIYLRQGDALVLQHQVGYSTVIASIPLSSGVCGRVMRTGEAVLLPDVRADPAFLGAIGGIVSEVCVPIRDEGQTVGILNVESTQGVKLGPADLRLMSALSDHVGIAIGRARLYAALRASQEQYQSVVESMPGGVFQTDAEGCLTLVNPAWTAITGYTEAESLGRSFVTYLYPADQATARTLFARQATDVLSMQRKTVCLRHKTGAERQVDVTVRPMRLAPPSEFCGTLIDITERIQAEEQLTESEAISRSILGALHEGILLQDADYRIRAANPSAEHILGTSFRDMQQNASDIPLWQTLEEDGSPSVPEMFPSRVALRTGEPQVNKLVGIRRPDGSQRWVSVTAQPLFRPGAALPYAAVISFVDITEYKKAEEGLRESEERYRRLIEVSPVAIFVHHDGILRYANPAGVALLGADRATDVVGQPVFAFVAPEEHAFARDRIQELQIGGTEKIEFTTTIIRRDGQRRTVEIIGIPIVFDGAHAIQVVLRDVTEGKAIEDALRQERDFWQQVMDLLGQGVVVTDYEPRFTYVNPAFARMLGYSQDALIGLTPLDITPPEEMEKIKSLRDSWENGITRTVEAWRKRADGSLIPVLTTVSPRMQDGRAVGTIAAVTDLTERVRAETALRESEERYRRLVEASPEAIMVQRDGIFVYANPAALTLMGAASPSDVVGQPMLRFLLPERRSGAGERLRRLMVEGTHTPTFEEYIVRVDGQVRIVELTTLPITYEGSPAIQAVLHDTTEQKKTLDALRESEAAIRALHTITAAPNLTFSEKVQTLLRTGCTRFGLTVGVLSRIEGAQLRIIESSATLSDLAHDAVFDIDQTFAHETIRSVEPFSIASVSTSPWHNHPTYTRYGYEAILSTSVIVAGEVYGVLSFADLKPHDQPFTRADKEFLQLMAQWLGGEIERQQRATQLIALSEMGDLLQACLETSEAYTVIAQTAQRLFPRMGGGIGRVAQSRNLVEPVMTWGLGTYTPNVYAPDECWALRRGRTHAVTDTRAGLVCRHVHAPMPVLTLCVPLIAQGETLGVLHLYRFATDSGGTEGGRLTETQQRLAETLAEHSALALANLDLRETLRHQSLHDPLTGLYNRRYMEDSLEREIQRAARKSGNVGIVMCDLDRFKQVNDTYGHAAGDAVLRAFGALLRQQVRDEDIVCRYGGEEFLLILPDTTLAVTRQRAEQLCEAVRQLTIEHSGQELGSISISAGVAAFPDHGRLGSTVIEAADSALNRAKQNGRDRVEIGTLPEESTPSEDRSASGA